MKMLDNGPAKMKRPEAKSICRWKNVSGDYYPGCQKDGKGKFIYGERITETFTFCPHCGRRIEK